jgi:hypothetical protein
MSYYSRRSGQPQASQPQPQQQQPQQPQQQQAAAAETDFVTLQYLRLDPAGRKAVVHRIHTALLCG